MMNTYGGSWCGEGAHWWVSWPDHWCYLDGARRKPTLIVPVLQHWKPVLLGIHESLFYTMVHNMGKSTISVLIQRGFGAQVPAQTGMQLGKAVPGGIELLENSPNFICELPPRQAY